ncbi:MAG: NAD(P)-binding protein [Bacteroidota bacterium]
MTRKEFIKMCGLLGIGLPAFSSCNTVFKETPLKQSDKVLLIGAGAAGLTAAYLLHQKGIEVEVLEASKIECYDW